MATKTKATYLIFKDGDGIYGKVLKKGYGHLIIVSFDGFNWIVIEPVISQLKVTILPVESDADVIKDYFSGMTAVLMKEGISQDKRWICKLRLLTCALFAKYYLGIDSYSFTPYQLYKHIIKNNLGENYYGR